MIKASGDKHVILGLSEMNLKNLKKDKPMKIDGSALGLNKDILIIYGNTEADIVKILQNSFDLSKAKVNPE
jgi:hypothetical protein